MRLIFIRSMKRRILANLQKPEQNCEEMYKICKLTKSEATTSLCMSDEKVCICDMAQFRVNESHICFFVNCVVRSDEEQLVLPIETIEGSIVVTTILREAVSGMQPI